MGRVGSIFDPARTQLDSVRWMVEGPETDRQRQLVKSVSGLGSVRSVQRAAGFCKRRWNLQKLSTFAPKTAEISLDLLESLRISPNMVEILPDLLESELDLAGVVGFVYYISRVRWLKF